MIAFQPIPEDHPCWRAPLRADDIRRIATEMLLRAVADAFGGCGDPCCADLAARRPTKLDVMEARSFCLGQTGFVDPLTRTRHAAAVPWCDAAGVDPDAFRQRACKLLAECQSREAAAPAKNTPAAKPPPNSAEKNHARLRRSLDAYRAERDRLAAAEAADDGLDAVTLKRRRNRRWHVIMRVRQCEEELARLHGLPVGRTT